MTSSTRFSETHHFIPFLCLVDSLVTLSITVPVVVLYCGLIVDSYIRITDFTVIEFRPKKLPSPM